MRPLHRIILFVVLLGTSLFLQAPSLTAASKESMGHSTVPSRTTLPKPLAIEYSVKAAFIINFARYTRWPDNPAAKSSIMPLYVPAIRRLEEPFSRQKRKNVGRRTLTLIPLKSPTAILPCSVVFIDSTTSPERIQAILKAVADRPILTIGESNGMAQVGCILNFYREGNRLRFEVNLNAAKRAGIRLSSELLKLARILPNQTGANP